MSGSARAMIVAGVMSGTSADGVDVAVCRIGQGRDGKPWVKVLGHRGFAYPKPVRRAVLAAMDARSMSVADMSRLHWRLGSVYAECLAETCAEMGMAIPGSSSARFRGDGASPGNDNQEGDAGARAGLGLVGVHGQTVYHQATAERYLGAQVRCTWQIGEAAVIAERMRCPVVNDLRPADLAAGGQGAPLVPMLDWVMFRSARVGRVLQNLGGIGNLTAIPAGAGAEAVMAFDTGPANMVIDHCMRSLYGREFDRGGLIARRGRVLPDVVVKVMQERYFSAPPPKSCGREEFGERFGDAFIRMCRKAGAGDADVVATSTALTVESVLRAYRTFVMPRMGARRVEYAMSGGGARNTTLVRMLGEGLTPMNVQVRPMEDLGVAVEAKEAVAFALLAWLTWQRLPGNVPSATGATRPVVLGKICFG